ncbi:MAG TPA: hypothetical protein VGR67_12455 [Candidatus Polarisedimenticolia bacterium]|jgi:hypothetical protein|nr:hypothetical protein [Candidatus Polarisedimenticolia bacterium]
MQIDARFLPLALHRALHRALERRDLGEGKTAEELEVDDFGQGGIGLAQIVERGADARQLAFVDRLAAGVRRQGSDLDPPISLSEGFDGVPSESRAEISPSKRGPPCRPPR